MPQGKSSVWYISGQALCHHNVQPLFMHAAHQYRYLIKRAGVVEG